MPRTSAYTLAPGRLAQLAAPARADLHVHTTASDGEYTPSQVVAQARLARLHAVAVTDHDTLAGVDEARAAAAGHLEVVPGVEISAGFGGGEVHLLGYFVRTDHDGLNAALAAACAARRERFRDFVALLRARGLSIPADRAELIERATASPGRRHVAALLVACGHAHTRASAVHRFVNPLVGTVKPKALVPAEEAIRLVRAAGGVASLAHPSPDTTDEQFGALRSLGLGAVEAVYPWGRNGRGRRLREVAGRFGFAVSGGSDCHGPEPAHRRIGSHAVTADELGALRERARESAARATH
ncbi:MAG: PHP domain-containing protein [Planctomycetes bacterium]|nr:PHP domain-containing protein [Planctomycetota bacterium]